MAMMARRLIPVDLSGSVTARLLASASLLLLLALIAPADVSGTPCVRTAKNCLPSCKTRCRTAKCLYQCHYDTSLGLLKLAITPPEGATLDAFNGAVAQLGDFLEEDVVVRIDPLGIYRGKAEVADYIATFVHPLGLGSRSRVNNVVITHFVNTGNVSALTAHLMFANVGDPTQRITNLTGILFNYFDNVTQKIVKGDWHLVRLPQFQEDLFGVRVPDTVSAGIVRAVCGVNEQVCKPAGVSGYESMADCLAFMASIPRIAPYGIQGNNQYCRFLHMAYATVDPKVHCPHMGKSGGGVCVDQVYTDYFKVFPQGQFMPKL